MPVRRSILVSSIGLFAGLAVAITLTGFEIPFPLLPYLKFDFAEIPVIMALFLLGPFSGLVTCFIYGIALMAARGWVLGPAMKFIAVASTILGFLLGTKASCVVRKQPSTSFSFTVGTVFSIIVRVFTGTVTNIIVLLWVAPEFLFFALLWSLLFTGIFNLLHTLLSSVPPAIILKGAALRIPWISENAWFLTLGKKRG